MVHVVSTVAQSNEGIFTEGDYHVSDDLKHVTIRKGLSRRDWYMIGLMVGKLRERRRARRAALKQPTHIICAVPILDVNLD